jgi:hypothetical protein
MEVQACHFTLTQPPHESLLTSCSSLPKAFASPIPNTVMNAKTLCPTAGGAAHHRGAAGATAAGQCSCTSLISRAFPHLWPRGPEISFCHTIDYCRTILYYSILFVLYLGPAPRRRYCRLFTLLFRPGGLTGPGTLINTLSPFSVD